MHPRMTAAVGIAAIGVSAVLWQGVPASEQAIWQVTDLDSGPSSSADIAIDAGGNAQAVWINAQRVRTATFQTATGAWSPAITLSTPIDFASDARVGSNAAGDAIAVWRKVRFSDSTTYLALSRYFAATRTWDTELELATKGFYPQAVVDGQGNITVVWSEFLSMEQGYYYPYEVHGIRSLRYDAATTSWRSPINLSGEYASQPRVGIDDAGNVTVLWTKDGFIESVRLSSGTNAWSATTKILMGVASAYISPGDGGRSQRQCHRGVVHAQRRAPGSAPFRGHQKVESSSLGC